ncbi:MAG: hypothetical protein AAB527_01180 [Patescibacteria group bacterium]
MFIEILGWLGTILIVGAYFLVSSKKLDSQGVFYQSTNLLGAIFVGINVFYKSAWPALGLQVVWGLISIWAILNYVVPKGRKLR